MSLLNNSKSTSHRDFFHLITNVFFEEPLKSCSLWNTVYTKYYIWNIIKIYSRFTRSSWPTTSPRSESDSFICLCDQSLTIIITAIFGNLLKENSDIISVIIYWIVYRSLVYTLKVYAFNNFYADGVVFFSPLLPRYQTMPITKVRITVIGIKHPWNSWKYINNWNKKSTDNYNIIPFIIIVSVILIFNIFNYFLKV